MVQEEIDIRLDKSGVAGGTVQAAIGALKEDGTRKRSVELFP